MQKYIVVMHCTDIVHVVKIKHVFFCMTASVG